MPSRRTRPLPPFAPCPSGRRNGLRSRGVDRTPHAGRRRPGLPLCSSRSALAPRRLDDVEGSGRETTTTLRPAVSRAASLRSQMTFDTLGLSADLLRTVAEEGYEQPTPVQAKAIPLVLDGRDVLAAAQTGTGKTAAFTLPILDRLRSHANTSFSPARHPHRVLTLVPTRSDPASREASPANATVEAIRPIVYRVDRDRKEELLAHLIRKDDLRQVLVFTRTKIGATRLATWLDRQGLNAVAIHSDRTQPERTRALEEFKTGEIRVLVATDVAARGLDIEDLPHVVNFELPWNPQDYIHRIGRTGRAGATGEAISLVSIDEVDLLRGVQRLLKLAIPWAVEEGFVPDRNAEPQPIGHGGRQSTGDRARAPRRPVRHAGAAGRR